VSFYQKKFLGQPKIYDKLVFRFFLVLRYYSQLLPCSYPLCKYVCFIKNLHIFYKLFRFGKGAYKEAQLLHQPSSPFFPQLGFQNLRFITFDCPVPTYKYQNPDHNYDLQTAYKPSTPLPPPQLAKLQHPNHTNLQKTSKSLAIHCPQPPPDDSIPPCLNAKLHTLVPTYKPPSLLPPPQPPPDTNIPYLEITNANLRTLHSTNLQDSNLQSTNPQHINLQLDNLQNFSSLPISNLHLGKQTTNLQITNLQTTDLQTKHEYEERYALLCTAFWEHCPFIVSKTKGGRKGANRRERREKRERERRAKVK
jgi:hypothetical protein